MIAYFVYLLGKEKERRNRADILKAYKMYSGFSAVPFGDMYEISDNTQTRGHNLKSAKNRCRLDMRKVLIPLRMLALCSNVKIKNN